uniref:Protein-serine/threonine phosphatase n=1 Tax=Setaria digitata TaxID=48799 RepID=A0A915PQK5_9BILA
MDDTAGSKSHWYDKLYDVCKYSNGYSVPEAFYGSGKVITDGYGQQHKTFSYVLFEKSYIPVGKLSLLGTFGYHRDQRSGRTVRLYGIIDRYSPGADADFLISQIVSDILPFDRTTDHVLNNDPSDRQIYCLLDEALRKVYKVDLNSSSAFTRSYRESDSRRSPASSGSRIENNGILQMGGFPSGSLTNYPHRSPGPSVSRCENNGTVEVNGFPPGNYTKTNGVNLPNLAPMNPPITEAVAQRLSVMEFLNFYKDIIERVDQAANADERKYMEMTRMNQVNPYVPVFNPPNEGYFPQTAPVQYSIGNSYIGVPPQDHYTHKSTRRRNYFGGRKLVARNTTLPTISESAEKWWNEESETLMYPEQQQYREQEQNLEFPDNTVLPQAVPPTFQRAPVLTPIESPRVGNDEEFLKAVEEIATDLGYIENSAFRENGETASVRSDDKYSNTDSDDSVSSFTAAAIVFIYGNKMFIGSIGDSRIILMRQKCHYLDVMYLNEPPLAWYPIAAAKNPHFKAKRYILFQEPIVRGGFLINEYSIFLLMFNDGVITNMLNVNEYYRTSNEVNRSAVQMVIKIIEKYPSSDIAEKFIAQIMHWCNRKYWPFQNLNGAKREGMSFLFADLRQLMPKQPDYGHLLRKYQAKGTLISKAESYPKMVTFSQHLEDDEETMKHASSMNKVYDMLQEIFDREESERRAQENPLKDKALDGETWVVLVPDPNNVLQSLEYESVYEAA